MGSRGGDVLVAYVGPRCQTVTVRTHWTIDAHRASTRPRFADVKWASLYGTMEGKLA